MAPPVKEVVLASLPLEEEGKGMAPLVNEAVLTASRLEVEGKGNYIELEKEKVEEGTSDLEDEIWHDKEPSKIWPDEEPIKLLKNKKGSLGLDLMESSSIGIGQIPSGQFSLISTEAIRI